MNMATPVHKLPEGATNAPHDADEVVTAVLQDMENDLEDAAHAQAGGQAPPPAQRRPSAAHAAPAAAGYAAGYPPAPRESSGVLSLLELDIENLKLAGIVAVLGTIAFYPNLTQTLYEKIPRLSVLETYDMFVRAFLLGVFFYVLLTYVQK